MPSLSNYDEVLKVFYLPGIQDYLNNGTPLASMIETNQKDVSGKSATIENHYGRSTGTGSRADGGALPTASYQKFKTSTVPMKYHYGRVNLNGPLLAATKDEKGAYGKALDIEITGIVEDLKKETNRQMWGCGYGILGRWRSGATTSQTVQKKYRGNSVGGDAFGSTFGSKYLEKRNDSVPVVVTLAGNNNGTFVVDETDMATSAITRGADYDTITVTDPSVTEAIGTFYVRPSGLGTYAASGAHRLEMMGLSGLVGNTDLDNIALADGIYTGGTTNDPLQGLAVATYPWFTSIVDTHASGRYAGQRALTLTLMQTIFDMVEETAGKDYGPNVMFTTRAIRREYLELCQADRRTVNTMELDGGWTGLDYNGIPLLVDNDAIDGEIHYLTTKDLQIYRMSDYEWMQKDGAILSRISGYDMYEAVIYRYAEFGVTNRATQAVLCDLSYTKSINEGYGG